MQLQQNDLEHIKDLLHRGEINADRANVMMVLAQRVKLVTRSMPANVRKALNEAVKAGELRRVKKDGHKPEAYFHPTFEYIVAGERNAHERAILEASRSVMATMSDVMANAKVTGSPALSTSPSGLPGYASGGEE